MGRRPLVREDEVMNRTFLVADWRSIWGLLTVVVSHKESRTLTVSELASIKRGKEKPSPEPPAAAGSDAGAAAVVVVVAGYIAVECAAFDEAGVEFEAESLPVASKVKEESCVVTDPTG